MKFLGNSPLDDPFENGCVDVGQGDDLLVVFFDAEILQHGLDSHTLLGDPGVNLKHLAVAGLELDGRHAG